MSDPVVKGAKRNTSRPAPQSASTKSSAKGGKATPSAAKPKALRATPEKAPARKAAPAKPSRTAAKPTAKSATKKSPAPSKSAAPKKEAAKPKAAQPRLATASKAGPAQKIGPQPAKKAAAKPQPAKAPAAAAQPSKAQPAKAPAGRNQAPAPSRQPPPPSPRQPAPQAARQAKPAAPPAPSKTPAKGAPRHPPQPRQPSRDEAAALKAFERAHKEFARGNFEAARDLFRGLIVQHAGVSEVAARARTYLNIAEARLRSEAALPRDADALYDRGVFEMNRGDFVAAQEMFERALKRDASAADTHYALAAARARLGAVETAIKALEQAVGLNPKLRLRAQTDIDFIGLRNEPEFERIIFAGPRG